VGSLYLLNVQGCPFPDHLWLSASARSGFRTRVDSEIGQTNVLGAAAGMGINIAAVTGFISTIANESPAVATARTLTAAENAAVAALDAPGVAYFKYFIAPPTPKRPMTPSFTWSVFLISPPPITFAS
jgi:hypothetical protein